MLLQNLSQARASGRRFPSSETASLPNLESRNTRRPSSSIAGGLPPLERCRVDLIAVQVDPSLYFC